MTSILVTGCNGQIGKELQYLSQFHSTLDFVFVHKEKLDITDSKAINRMFSSRSFDYCINCAAYTRVDEAENEKELAFEINAQAVKMLARACNKYKTNLIHFSTDYVYHSNFGIPFKETSVTNPQSVYAHSKLQGENYALTEHNSTLVIRTSWVYSSFGQNFVKTMLRLGEQRTSLNVVCDQIGTPTYARDLAKAIIHIMLNKAYDSFNGCSGIYNYSNSGETSWYNFAKSIFDMKSIPCTVIPIRSEEYPSLALRPPYSVLDKTKIIGEFDLTIQDWTESLEECLHEL